MALMGAAYIAVAPIVSEGPSGITYGTGFQVGGLNQVDRNIAYVESELPADDVVKYKLKQFGSGELAVKLSEFPLEHQAVVFGQTLDDGTLSKRSTDKPPYLGIGYINTVLRKDESGVDEVVYRVYLNPKTQAYPGNKSATTKGSSIQLTTEDFTATIFQPEYADWEIVKEFDALASAKGYIADYLGIATYHTVNVLVTGATTGESASPVGTTMIADGEDFELTVTGTVTALYDNGVESKSSITADKYTVADVSADHNIAVIF